MKILDNIKQYYIVNGGKICAVIQKVEESEGNKKFAQVNRNIKERVELLGI